MFVSKLKEKLQYIVNFKQLNVITKKNYYLLLNIKKTKNYLKKAKWFLKINLQNAFYII